ncbi:MAG: hypothetical protein JSV65_10130 [Armatimonadota bacterium]|nr:MAG: hypothetical protein JSV65_10130 [Armatimonadota bacterium]
MSNAIDVKVPPRGVGDAGPGAQQLVVTGTRMTPQAYYVFSPVGPHVEAAAEELEGRKLRGGKAAPAKPLWDVVLQNVALQQGIYVLAPSGFPVREPAGTDAQPSERALATALKRMGYEARPQEGAITIEPVAPGRAAPGQTRRRRG